MFLLCNRRQQCGSGGKISGGIRNCCVGPVPYSRQHRYGSSIHGIQLPHPGFGHIKQYFRIADNGNEICKRTGSRKFNPVFFGAHSQDKAPAYIGSRLPGRIGNDTIWMQGVFTITRVRFRGWRKIISQLCLRTRKIAGGAGERQGENRFFRGIRCGKHLHYICFQCMATG
jgi:hypothetical protein